MNLVVTGFRNESNVEFAGGPLLLMELAFLLRSVGTEVCWVTIQRPVHSDEVTYSLENKMLDRGVQVSETDLFVSSDCFGWLLLQFVVCVVL